jgi:uncharacterized protein involved in type VI secretion and phage assembly
LEAIFDPREADQRIYGVVVGIVTNNKDPDNLGRVRVQFPWLSDSEESNWARVATPMAGAGRGLYVLPEVNDEVLVAFEQGLADMPYVIGSLWNGKDAPPETNDDGHNDVRVLKSRSGHLIRLDDKQGEEKIEIIDKGGKNKVVIDTKTNAITIEAQKDITVKAASGKLAFEAQTIEMKANGSIRIEGTQGVDVKSSGQTNIKGALVNLN